MAEDHVPRLARQLDHAKGDALDHGFRVHESGDPVGEIGFVVGLEQARPNGNTAGIVVLDNRHGDLVVFFCQFERRIGVEKIVIRHRLAV